PNGVLAILRLLVRAAPARGWSGLVRRLWRAAEGGRGRSGTRGSGRNRRHGTHGSGWPGLGSGRCHVSAGRARGAGVGSVDLPGGTLGAGGPLTATVP